MIDCDPRNDLTHRLKLMHMKLDSMSNSLDDLREEKTYVETIFTSQRGVITMILEPIEIILSISLRRIFQIQIHIIAVNW